MKISYSPLFKRMFKKLERKVQEAAEDRETIFRENIFDPRLGTHKLHGRLKELWAFEVDNRNRIVFEFKTKDEFEFHFIGDHSIYE